MSLLTVVVTGGVSQKASQHRSKRCAVSLNVMADSHSDNSRYVSVKTYGIEAPKPRGSLMVMERGHLIPSTMS